jgi:malonyl CoA-acyl carrier protein transacylase
MHSAFVFPGQGSQSVSMLAELSESFPQVQQTFAEASDALGYDLWALVQNGPEAELNQTDKTQPAMLAAGIAVWRCWESVSDDKPAYLAGHSLALWILKQPSNWWKNVASSCNRPFLRVKGLWPPSLVLMMTL